MIKKTLYFGHPTYLSLKNNQLEIRLPEVEKNEKLSDPFKEESMRSIPIEDIGVAVLDHRQITITQGAMEMLLENNAALITCDQKSLPVGLMLPLYGNTTQNERFRNQLEVSSPLKKQLWQQTIQCKIRNQAAVLHQISKCPVKNMISWANNVRSGDPENIEARAAAYYWKNLW